MTASGIAKKILSLMSCNLLIKTIVNYSFMLTWFIKKTLFIALAVYIGMAVVLFASQELFIFPMLRAHLGFSDPEIGVPPDGIEEFFVKTEDGNDINVWTTFKKGEQPKNIAMVFHGNGETVASQNFLPFFRDLGIPAFTFDYRGYGRSSGWPSEAGINLDADAVWSEIQRRTGINANQLIIIGNSIGTGPATRLAHRVSPKALILIAAYSDFPTLVSGMPVYAPFLFTLRYKLPVAEYLKDIKTDCVIFAHGIRDEIIPFSHRLTNASAVNPNVNSIILDSETARHGDIFYKTEDRLKVEVLKCLN